MKMTFLLILLFPIKFSLAGNVNSPLFIHDLDKDMLLQVKDLRYEDFEHENKGCPENSLCDKQMGQHRRRWLNFIKALKKNKLTESEQIKKIEAYRKKNGIPVSFLSKEDSIESFRPILFSSECRQHLSRKKNHVLLGQAFIQNTKNHKASVVKGQKVQRIPLGPKLSLDPLTLYQGQKKILYYVPHRERPAIIRGEELIFILEEEGVYFGLSIRPNGAWKVVSIPLKSINKTPKPGQDQKCPEEISELDHDFYQSNYCHDVFDLKARKSTLMNLAWSC